MAQIYFLIKNNQLVQDSFSGFFYSLVSLLYIARSRRLYILGKLYNFRLLLIKKIINPPHFRHKPSKKKKEKKEEEIIYMYLHVITSGIRNRTCTWQENIDLVQDMIIIGGHLYLKCNFNRVCLNCSLILWLNYSLLQLINLQNDLIKNTIRMTVVNLFLKIFAC